VHTPADFVPAHELPTVIAGSALAFAFVEGRLLIAGEAPASPRIPTLAELEAAGASGARHFLGELSGVPCLALVLPDGAAVPQGFAAVSLRAVFMTLPEPMLALAGRALQVAEWERTHRYCGRCAAPTRDRAGERAKECPACGLVAYPRVSPAMMVLVTRGRELLLARAQRFPGAMYSALAGFVESGETIEDCIRRETREEVGVEVDGIRYFASQSWPFPHSLMIAFTAEYAGGDMRPCDPEIADARWFTPDALPELPNRVSIARRLIDATVERLASGASVYP
jgi:NAD+ diphosphatase